MIRLLMAGVMVLMAGSANAASVGDTYKICKNYADNGFNYEKPTDAACIAYFGAIRDRGASVCDDMKSLLTDEDLDINEQHAFGFVQKIYGVGELGDMNSAIQHFVNKMKNEPERWEYRADQAVLESVQAMAPCE